MKSKKNWLINSAYYIVLMAMIGVITYVVFTWLLPCFFSVLVVMALQPLISNIIKMLKIENKYLAVFVSIFVYLVIIAGVLYLLFLGMIQLYVLLAKLPQYVDYVYVFLQDSGFFTYFSEYMDIFYASISQIIQNYSSSFIAYLINFLAHIPSTLFDIMFIIVSSLFFIIDYKNIKAIILSKSSREEYVVALFHCVKETISSLFKAYIIIFIITFIELLLGFYILGLKDALMIAFAIAAFDFLPVLGLDMIFIPWISILAFKNQMALAIGLLVIYIVITISKNIMEPKLISKQTGLHPLLTIVGMFIGAKVFGVLGMIFVPVLIMISKRIYELNKEYNDG